MKLGKCYANFRVANSFSPEKEIFTLGLVDTGATHLTLPNAWRSKLGEFKIISKRKIELGDGRIIEGELCGPFEIQLEAMNPFSGEVLFVEMDQVEGRYEPIIGHFVLQYSNAGLDAVTHRVFSWESAKVIGS